MRNETLIARFRAPVDQGNQLANMQPMNWLVILVSLTVIGVMSSGWVVSAAVISVIWLLGLLGGVGWSYTKALANLFFIVGLILFILRALLTPGTTMFAIGPVHVSREGFDYGLEFSLHVMVVCAAVGLYFVVVPRSRLTYALERMKVSPKVSYVILASFQAITDLGKNSKVVLDAQKARGIETDKGIGSRVSAFFPVLAPVFLVALTQTEEKAIALDARAFNTDIRKTSLTFERKVPAWEWILVGFFVLAAVLIALGRGFGWISLG